VEWKQWEGHVIDGKFHLRQYLGGSAHSAVFATEYGEETPRKAAIKLVPADAGLAHVWLLRRELAARLSHPGLISIFEFGIAELGGAGLVYTVMELSDEDLSQVIPTRPLSAEETREMLTAVLETLAYIHAEGFVHGCLTPSNIMAVGDRVKISSDGLLRIGESSDQLWAQPMNGPPEGRDGMTPAGDVWWLGMTIAQVLTQRAPAWEAGGTNNPVMPKQLQPPFVDLARRCLQTAPHSRCSLADIARALQPSSLATQGIPAVVEPVAAAKAPVHEAPEEAITISAAPKKPYLWFVAAAVMCGMMGTSAILTGFGIFHSPPRSEPHAAAPPAVAVHDKPQPFATTRSANSPAAVPAAMPVAVPAVAPIVAVSEPLPDHSTDRPAGADVVNRVMPQVPQQYLKTIRGVVVVSVRARVDRFGDVAETQLDSRGGSRYFDRLALDAAKRWKFKPATYAGHDMESTQLLRFEFRPAGCEASSAPPKAKPVEIGRDF
jgi:TonB family protein